MGLGDGGGVFGGISVHVHVHTSWTCTSHVFSETLSHGYVGGGVRWGGVLTFMYMFIYHGLAHHM